MLDQILYIRGFVYVRESEDLMDGAKNVIKDVLHECEEKNIKEWAYLKNNIKENLKEYLYTKQKKSDDITNNHGSII